MTYMTSAARIADALLAGALCDGIVAASQRDARPLVAAGLLARTSGKGHGKGNSPVWVPTLAAKAQSAPADRTVRFGKQDLEVVGEIAGFLRVRRPGSSIIFKIVKPA